MLPHSPSPEREQSRVDALLNALDVRRRKTITRWFQAISEHQQGLLKFGGDPLM
jgi:hypothetical protein